jgi:hypothetical protein
MIYFAIGRISEELIVLLFKVCVCVSARVDVCVLLSL